MTDPEQAQHIYDTNGYMTARASCVGPDECQVGTRPAVAATSDRPAPSGRFPLTRSLLFLLCLVIDEL